MTVSLPVGTAVLHWRSVNRAILPSRMELEYETHIDGSRSYGLPRRGDGVRSNRRRRPCRHYCCGTRAANFDQGVRCEGESGPRQGAGEDRGGRKAASRCGTENGSLRLGSEVLEIS